MSSLPKKEVLADGIELWRADFREVLPHEVGDIDAIITDPPYEQRTHDAMGVPIRGLLKRQNIDRTLAFAGMSPELRDDLLVRVHMKCRGWLVAFCSTEGVAAWRDAIEKNKLKYKTPMIWVKPDAMPKFNGQGPAHGHECLVSAWCGTGYSRWNGGGRKGVFTHNGNPVSRDHTHPTEKPLALMAELVQLFSNFGEYVCDPFMGSGSTALACLKLGRKFIGIEIDESYFDLSCRRISDALKQGDMFAPARVRAEQGKLL